MPKKLTQLERMVIIQAQHKVMPALYGKQLSIRRATHENIKGHGHCVALHESYRAYIDHEYHGGSEDKYRLRVTIKKQLQLHVYVEARTIHDYILERNDKVCYLYFAYGDHIEIAHNHDVQPRPPRFVLAKDVGLEE